MRQLILLLALLVAATQGGGIAQAAEEVTWREVDPERLIFMELHEGMVAIELSPEFAPRTAKQFSKLVQERFYDGLSFYRVIDGFVAQAGDGSDLGEFSNSPLIDREFERKWSDDFPWIQAQQKDLFAPVTGFVNGFAVARDPDKGTAWLAHCPGTVAMARNDDPDSSRTDFYIVIGQAPRYLDRNMNVFGRVIEGMNVLQSIKRGESMHSGVIRDETARSRIRSMKLASDIPEEDRPSAYVMDTTSEGFEDLLKDRRERKQKFFHNKPPKVLDVCQVPMAGFLTK